MRGPLMCHRLQSVRRDATTSRSPGWCPSPSSNILNSTTFTRLPQRAAAPDRAAPPRRQAGCMAKTEKRHKAPRIPKEVTDAIAAAEDKKAIDIVLLDLRKA